MDYLLHGKIALKQRSYKLEQEDKSFKLLLFQLLLSMDGMTILMVEDNYYSRLLAIVY